LTTTVGSGDDVANALAVQADGKIVVAGRSSNGDPSDFAVVRYRGDNRSPVALPATFSVNEDATLSVTSPTYYFDGESDLVTTLLRSGPAHATLPLNPYGQSTYTPFANYNGTDSFSYRLDDSHGGSSTGSVSLTVVPQNDAPTASNDLATVG